jgi:hypothetical protein
MDLGVAVLVAMGTITGLVVLQAVLAARHWDRVISDGDVDALTQALDEALEDWRTRRPPKGTPPADWQALQSATLIAADRDRCRVSLLASTDVRVVNNERQDFGDVIVVARRAAVSMTERLLYEIPHVRFDEVQIDVYSQTPIEGSDGSCVLTTRVAREVAYVSEWDNDSPEQILSEWETAEANDGTIDPEEHALIAAEAPGEVLSPGETI